MTDFLKHILADAELVDLILGALAVIAWRLVSAISETGLVQRAAAKAQIEEKHVRGIQNALANAVRRGMAGRLTGDALIEDAIDYARRSYPEAMTWLEPTQDALRTMAEAEVQRARLETTIRR